jgi:hypothetical protein
MKTKSMICVFAMMCIFTGLVQAKDELLQIPMGPVPGSQSGGGAMVDPSTGLPVGQPGMMMGGGMGMMPGMPAGGMGMDDQEFPKDAAASCLLKISCDPSILRLDYRVIKHLWFSTGVLNKAYRDVLKDPNMLDCSGYIFLLNDAGTPVDTMYSVAIPGMSYGKEKEILAAAVENLKSALLGMGDEERERFRDQLKQTDYRCDEKEKMVADMQAQVRVITQEGVTNQQQIQDKISGLKNSLADTQMRLQYNDIRINELRKQKDELQSAIEKSLVADTVIAELKNIVKGTEESLITIEKMFSAGQAPADKIQEAREKLARAKIELARRMEEVRKTAGQDQLADIDGKIAGVNSQVSEFKLGFQFKEKEYGSMTEQLAKSDALELLTMKLDAAKKSYFEMLGLRENLKNRLLMQQPLSVSVIGLD